MLYNRLNHYLWIFLFCCGLAVGAIFHFVELYAILAVVFGLGVVYEFRKIWEAMQMQ